jgi:hypothetical protein
MSEELYSLMSKLQPSKGDTVVFVGDLMDKGPDSLGVVRLVREWSENGPFQVVLVEGNHEDTHRRYRRNMVVRPEVGQQQHERKPELLELTSQLSDEDVLFLGSSVLFHRVPEHNVLVVHGGIPGTLTKMPESPDDLSDLTSKERKRLNLVMRTRRLDRETGHFLKLSESTEDDPMWSELYDGRFGHVVFGHEPFMDGPYVSEHSTGVDTGSVFGGRLTSLVLDSEGSRSFVSVPSRKFSEVKG